MEMKDKSSRPELADTDADISAYDTIYVGFPIWWYTAPTIVNTFMESYDFSGKMLAAFCTSASRGFGSSDSALREAADSASWLDGIRFSSGASDQEILEWASGLGISGI